VKAIVRDIVKVAVKTSELDGKALATMPATLADQLSRHWASVSAGRRGWRKQSPPIATP
jgi:hypothetical protein